MDLTKEALEYLIEENGANEIEVLNGQTYTRYPLNLIREPVPAALQVRSLSGFVQYIRSQFDGKLKLMVHVTSPTEVVAFTSFNSDKNREVLIKAEALLPRIEFGSFIGTEQFIISLQAAFVPTEHRNDLLKIVGNIKEENVQQFGDDGVSQQVTAKTGVTAVETVKVPNPVVLQPFRTFVEVEQPESEFIFRMKSGSPTPYGALYEADGGAWKIAAMQNIKGYLKEELQSFIDAELIVIIA